MAYEKILPFLCEKMEKRRKKTQKKTKFRKENDAMKFPIGAILESFCMPTDDAVRRAAELGAQGIQMYSTKGENAPENLTPAKRADE